MKFEIKGQPVFNFGLRVSEIDLIYRCAMQHYDSTCQRAAAPLVGFVYGWSVRADLSPPDALIDVSATWGELDTVLKILENTSHLSVDERVVGDRLTRSFHLALVAARGLMVSDPWTHRIDTRQRA